MTDPTLGMPALPGLPGVHFVHQGDEDAARLRGAEIMGGVAELGVGFTIGTAIALDPRRQSLLFVAMPNPATAQAIAQLVTPGFRVVVIVDIISPVWDPTLMTGTTEGFEFWGRPENLASIERGCRLAHAVTCPYGSWTPKLLDWNPNVFVLPDVTDDAPETITAYIGAFGAANWAAHREWSRRNGAASSARESH